MIKKLDIRQNDIIKMKAYNFPQVFYMAKKNSCTSTSIKKNCLHKN